jgi:diguanylate cyclase (GGDEF)-like protein
MNQERLEAGLDGIRNLLSHLQSEVTTLEQGYAQVLLVLRKLETACDVDDLTGLMRRNAFQKRWEAMLEECLRLETGCGVLLIDIDHFKRVNDTHGHPTGDEVIKRVADLLKLHSSPRCIVGRFGGEEFVVAVQGTDAEILGLAEMIRRGAERLHGPVVDKEGKADPTVEWKCTISIGMASSRTEKQYDAPRLLKAADLALYVAKSKGRNQVRAA